MKKTSNEDAKKYLSDVEGGRCFWVNNGPILKNLYELYGALKEMGNRTWQHHASSEKNDFAAWVKDVIGDEKLANDLLKAKNKLTAAKHVEARITSLKKICG